MTKETKEDLIVELAKIRQSHSEWVSGDERRRKEFAKAFGWYQEKQRYDYTQEIRMPSWEEIFTKVGKLLATKNFYDFEGNLSELAVIVEKLEQKISQNIKS